jgi:membrane-associated protein
VEQLVQYIVHIDVYLAQFVHLYGMWAYIALFVIIFLEMGCIVTPFLPGDSLLFAAGALAAASELNIVLLMVLLFVACFSGMLVNYSVGCLLGPKLFHVERSRFFNKSHLEKTRAYFERYGSKTIVIACFMPIIRTFAPFAAGVAKMEKHRFVMTALFGSLLWVVGLLYLSFAFGNLPIIKSHFSLLVVGIIALSLVVPTIELLRKRFV